MSSGYYEHENKKAAENRTTTRNSIGRGIFVAASMILQVVWAVLTVTFFYNHYFYIEELVKIAMVGLVLYIYAKRENAAFKLPWIMLILAFPILGTTLYFMITRSSSLKKMKRRYAEIDDVLLPALPDSSGLIGEIEKEDPTFAGMARYIQTHGGYPKGYPVYRNTKVTFYPDAVPALEAQKEALRNAKSFIFMEYHAIEDRLAFKEVHEILRQKAAEGVEVRLIYDDLGSIIFINGEFRKKLISEGIQCRVFNPVFPILQTFQNNRDHRKITVVDGQVGFTGGYNMADEYFHLKKMYGFWKDSGLKLEGEAVTSFTLMFLEMWNAIDRTDEKAHVDVAKYFPKTKPVFGEMGFVQPYADSPMDNIHVGEDVYMNLINAAQKYIYITTPYLVITDDLARMLRLAAQRGVDVRIITPGIPDKRMVFNVTRSYYSRLVESGVRIFEFSPGFVHAKECVCDGKYALCGTINLDYRSFYHHFEDGVLLYKTKAVRDIEKDFRETFPRCEEVTEKYRHRRRLSLLKLWQVILRLFAPLM